MKFYVKLFLQYPNVQKSTVLWNYYATDVVSSDQFTHCEVRHIIPVRRELSNSVIFPVTSAESLCLSGL